MAAIQSLTTIPEPPEKTRTVLEHSGAGTTFFTGTDLRDPYWCCGQCRAVLAAHVPRARLGDAVLKCNGCGSFNDPRQ